MRMRVRPSVRSPATPKTSFPLERISKDRLSASTAFQFGEGSGAAPRKPIPSVDKSVATTPHKPISVLMNYPSVFVSEQTQNHLRGKARLPERLKKLARPTMRVHRCTTGLPRRQACPGGRRFDSPG